MNSGKPSFYKWLVAIVAAAAVVYAAPLYDKTLYHTSAYLVKIGCESSSNGHLDLVLPQTDVF